MIRIVLISLFTVLFFSCSTKKSHEKYHHFSDQSWCTDSIVSFEFNHLDTTKNYNLWLNIRHTVNYQFQNLFVFTYLENKKDTIELKLANKQGKWFGSGLSHIREYNCLIQKNYKPIQTFEIKIEQAMRYGGKRKIESLKHITAVGVQLTENE